MGYCVLFLENDNAILALPFSRDVLKNNHKVKSNSSGKLKNGTILVLHTGIVDILE